MAMAKVARMTKFVRRQNHDIGHCQYCWKSKVLAFDRPRESASCIFCRNTMDRIHSVFTFLSHNFRSCLCWTQATPKEVYQIWRSKIALDLLAKLWFKWDRETKTFHRIFLKFSVWKLMLGYEELQSFLRTWRERSNMPSRERFALFGYKYHDMAR